MPVESHRESLDIEAPDGHRSSKTSQRDAAWSPVTLGGAFAAVLLLGGGILYMTKDGRNPEPEVPGGGSVGLQLKAPWWIQQGVIPEGPQTDMGTWKAITFSKEQQEHFGVDAMGKVVDKAKYDAAIAAMNVEAKAPWWITAGVTPEGPVKDMGGWTASTFSKDQQALYGVQEFGSVVDREKFNKAIAALPNSKGLRVLPPWWILHNVKPLGTKQDMGGWEAITFSHDQREQFGIDKFGVILNKTKFTAAMAKLTEQGRGFQRIAPWWIQDHVVPMGPEKDMGGWNASTFSEDQQKEFGVDVDGTVTNQDTFDAAIKALRAKGVVNVVV